MQEHRAALWAGIAELSQQKEMLGGELRDVFDAHPPQPLNPDEAAAGPLDDMHIWTPNGRQEAWPYGTEWFRDTYPKPYWVRIREEQEAAAATAGAAAVGGSGSSAGSESE